MNPIIERKLLWGGVLLAWAGCGINIDPPSVSSAIGFFAFDVAVFAYALFALYVRPKRQSRARR